jgi:lycopene cyclase domain-containing protein
MEYFLILIGILLITILMDYKYHVKLYNSRKERIFIPLLLLIFGIVWDTFAIWRGHWSFNDAGLLGIKIGLMPLEEYLFMLIIPYAILTHYKVLKKEI